MPKSKQRQKQRPSRNKRVEKKMEAVQRLNPFISNYIKKLESENERMKTDPETTLGQLVPQLRETLSQNKRLSVLVAAIIEAQGGSVKLTKEALEAFESKVLSIKWTLPEGIEKVEEASEFIFTYEALTQEEVAARNAEVKVVSNAEGQPTTVEIIGGPAPDVPFEAVAEDSIGNPINDLGNTVAAQADMDAITTAHDETVDAESESA
jgi:hypothetical protein